MSQRDPHIGKSFGNIHIERQLGAGGMGAVYQGVNPTTRKRVAVKVLHRGDAEGSTQFRERFLREIQVAARIVHPNVVQVLDAGVQDDVVYLVMELVSGGSLGDRLDDGKRMKPDEVQQIGLGLAKGLLAIHNQGIIHRDIKPDNVLLEQDQTVKITDLGLARHLNDEECKRLTVTGMVVGTPYYLAPEAIRDSRNAGPATDLYSLGATLYHCLAGRPPFDAPSAYDVMRMHLEERYQPLREIDRRIPRALADLVDCCLDKDPDSRPSARDVVLALEYGRKLKRETRGMGFVAMLLIGLVGAIAIGSWQLLRPDQGQYRQAQSADAASLSFQVDHPEASLRIDLDEWHPLRTEPYYLEPGPYRLEVQAHRDGTLLSWHDEIQLHKQEQRQIPVKLQVNYLPNRHVRIELEPPFTGMLVFAGSLRPATEPLYLDHAGSWTLAIWDGFRCQARPLQVHRDGRVELGDWRHVNSPPAEAYLRRFLRDRATLAHHLVTWWEAEQARRLQQLPSDQTWLSQSSNPTQAALNLSVPLVNAMHAWRSPHGLRLPNVDEAQELERQLGQALWHRQGKDLAISGGGHPSRAVLVLVAE